VLRHQPVPQAFAAIKVDEGGIVAAGLPLLKLGVVIHAPRPEQRRVQRSL
jgi:hypothetical protein